MKIAQIANVAVAVPPKKYGGAERVIYALTEGLVKKGHDVTLFARSDSKTSAKLVSVDNLFPRVSARSVYDGASNVNILNFSFAYQRQEEFDIIHDHNGVLSLPTANLSKTPVIYTLHYVYQKDLILYSNLRNPSLITISDGELAKGLDLNVVATIHHGLEMNHYPFSNEPEDYLLVIGRMHPDKGLHNAIKVAQALNMKLIIIARYLKDHDLEKRYFETMIKPHLNNQIRFIGEVDEKTRNRYMVKALCVLHAITWPEPFGLSMIEAMACGTPVIAFNKGSVSEIIKNGKTGFIVKDIREMIKAVQKIDIINRSDCRDFVLSEFTVERMVDEYEDVYQKIIAKKNQTRDTSFKVYTPPSDDYLTSTAIPLLYAHDIKK